MVAGTWMICGLLFIIGIGLFILFKIDDIGDDFK